MLLNKSKDRINLILIVTVLILLVGCSTAYYGTMEKLRLPQERFNGQPGGIRQRRPTGSQRAI